MADILQLMNPQEVNTYVQARVIAPKLGDALFPNERTEELRVKNVVGANGIPVVATIHAWDSESQIGSRDAYSEQELALTFIKRKLPIREEELIAITNPRTTTELDFLIKNRYNDVDTLVNGTYAKMEAMKLEALATGQINIDENGVVGTIDYGFDAEQKVVLAGTTPLDMPWTNPDADILGQLRNYVNTMINRGVIITRALTSNAVLNLILTNNTVKKAVNGTNVDKLVTIAELNTLLTAANLPILASYDEMYRFQKGDGSYEVRRYFPDGYVALLPDGPLGAGKVGPTPESRKLINKNLVKSVGDVTVQVYETEDPVMHWTKASASFIPTFPRANEVMSIKVK